MRRRRRPRQAVPDGEARVLAATVWADGTTVREVGRAAGMSSSATAYRHLRRWRAEGMVAWEPGRQGTLRPTFMAVPPPRGDSNDG